MRRRLVVVFGLWLGLGLGGAQGAGTPPADLLAQADAKLELARLSHDAAERFAYADEAARLCELAAAARPADGEPLLHLVAALTIGDPDHPERCRPGRCEKAVGVLDRVRKLDRLGLDAVRIAAEEGLLYARMERFADAVAAYDRAIPLVDATRRPNSLDDRNGTAVLWGNSAETAMALGRLDDAIRRYELAVEHAYPGLPEWQLALYGLAVALDRDGQVDRARRTMERVLELDPSISRLHEETVFFSPAGDLHYYEGLAYEVSRDAARAKAAFQAYLAAQPQARYTGRARAHVAQLAKAPPPSELGEVVIQPVRKVRGPRWEGAILTQVARRYRAPLMTCYERFLREHPGELASLSLAIEIAPQGFVAGRPHLMPGSEVDAALARCVELAADGWRFAPSGAKDSDVVVVPIQFSPVKKTGRIR